MNRIKEILIEKSLDEKYLANTLRIDIKLMRSWCKNKEQPSMNSLFKIARALGVSAGEVYVSLDTLK